MKFIIIVGAGGATGSLASNMFKPALAEEKSNVLSNNTR
jgi:ATP-dependent Clp protease ATP-binding subunit ClpA